MLADWKINLSHASSGITLILVRDLDQSLYDGFYVFCVWYLPLLASMDKITPDPIIIIRHNISDLHLLDK